MMPKRFQALGRLKTGEMNKTEAAYKKVLDEMQYAGDILWFKFEGVKFRLADNTFYTPDFCVMTRTGLIEFHEVKGSLHFIQDDAMVKIKVAQDLYPFGFKLVAPRSKKNGGGWDEKIVGRE